MRHDGDTCLFYIVFTVLPQNSWDTGDNSALQSNYLSVSVSSANTQRARCSLQRHRPPFASLTSITRHHRKVSIPHIKTLPTLASIIRACRTCTESHCLKQGTHRPQTPPPCCHPGSYCKRTKSSPVRPLACNWYYCAQFIAKPKDAYALRFSWAATSSDLGL